MEAKEKIPILLKEYDALRQEIVTRIGSRFAVVGLSGGALAFLVTLGDWRFVEALLGQKARLYLSVFGVASILVTWCWLGLLIKKLARGWRPSNNVSMRWPAKNSLLGSRSTVGERADNESRKPIIKTGMAPSEPRPWPPDPSRLRRLLTHAPQQDRCSHVPPLLEHACSRHRHGVRSGDGRGCPGAVAKRGRSAEKQVPQARHPDGRGGERRAAVHDFPRAHWTQIYSTCPGRTALMS